jgi:hypothetical protein
MFQVHVQNCCGYFKLRGQRDIILRVSRKLVFTMSHSLGWRLGRLSAQEWAQLGPWMVLIKVLLFFRWLQ